MNVERVQVKPGFLEVIISPGDGAVLTALEEGYKMLGSWIGMPDPVEAKFLLPNIKTGNPILEVDIALGLIQQVDLLPGPEGSLVATPQARGFRFENCYFKGVPKTAGNCLSMMQTAVEVIHWHARLQAKAKKLGRPEIPH